MEKTLPDWWIGARAPEATLGPWHVKLCISSEPTDPFTGWTWWTIGTPASGYVWQIHYVRVSIDASSLVKLALMWGSTDPGTPGDIIQVAYGYGSAELYIPKGLDYVSGNYLQVGVYIYGDEARTPNVSINGIQIKL